MSSSLQQYYGGTPDQGIDADQGLSDETRALYSVEGAVSASSALMGIASAAMRADDLELAAGDQIIRAEAEETAASERASRILQQQMEVSAGMRAAFAASGVDLGSGTVLQLDRENRRKAEKAKTSTLNRGARRAGQRRAAAKQLARKAAETFGAGVVDSVVSAASASFGGG